MVELLRSPQPLPDRQLLALDLIQVLVVEEKGTATMVTRS